MRSSSPWEAALRQWREHARPRLPPIRLPASGLRRRLWWTLAENWHLGITSFGGPPVHFKIYNDKFVKRLGWIDEQLYQELFTVCQAFCGPSSTKMLYSINLIHGGFPSAVLGFFLWALPGAIGMFGLAIGVSHIGESLPAAVYALLSGLNAATVGIIALAAVELARKAISDRLTRALVFLCAAVGLLFNALWYFPVLMAAAGLVTVIYDFRWLHRPARAVLEVLTLRRRRRPVVERGEDGAELSERETGRRDHVGEVDNGEETPSGPSSSSTQPPLHTSPTGSGVSGREGLPVNEREAAAELPARRSWTNAEARFIPPDRRFDFSWKLGLTIISLFFVSFVVVMVLRGVLPHKPILYSLFVNLYLAGTIIIGGGPVVIPLLREYVVTEGWVSGRDFLIGLALIQGFPGPNFNFAVYLGALTAISGGKSAAAGALIGFLGIFTPGLVLVQGTMGVWGAIRGWRAVRSAVRGIQASAIGFIYTAVYRLWQIGWFEEGSLAGTSLGNDPWWVVVTATSFVGGAWFGVSPPVAIVIGAVMGLLRYAVVQSS